RCGRRPRAGGARPAPRARSADTPLLPRTGRAGHRNDSARGAAPSEPGQADRLGAQVEGSSRLVLLRRAASEPRRCPSVREADHACLAGGAPEASVEQLEVALARAADRTEPVIRNVRELRARRDSAIGVALGGVVDEAAGDTDI